MTHMDLIRSYLTLQHEVTPCFKERLAARAVGERR